MPGSGSCSVRSTVYYEQTQAPKRGHFLAAACGALLGLAAWFVSPRFTSPICPVGGRVHFITYYVFLPLGTDFPGSSPRVGQLRAERAARHGLRASTAGSP